jgi:hypothetical protein
MPKAVTLAKRKSARDARHLMRYLMSKGGMSPQDIAKRDHVSVPAVIESIRQIEAYESMNADGQVKLAVNDLVLSLMPTAKDTMNGLLNATELVEITDHKTGGKKNIEVVDKTTRIEAMRLVSGIVSSLQPKGPGVAVQVNNNNQIAPLSQAETVEERMKRLRARAAEHNLLPAEVGAVPDNIDQGEDPDYYEEDDESEE